MNKFTLALTLLCGTTPVFGQTDWLDRLDEALRYETPNGFLRSELNGLLDLELYYNDQRPPGLVLDDDRFFFNPRLSLYLDTHLGDKIYLFAQARADRGFDPGGARAGEVRPDEYAIRYSPFGNGTLNFQAGKFATLFGRWVERHESWRNPFITAPLPYENVTTVTDQTFPSGPFGPPRGFLNRKGRADNKPAWLPVIWGPSYTAGASIFGIVEQFEYGLEFKNAALSSRPIAWDPFEENWDEPTVTGRLGWRPNAAFQMGASASRGAYLLDVAEPLLGAGKDANDYPQTTLGQDFSFAWHHWQVWAESILSRFEAPNVGDADTWSYFIEARYKATPRLFLAGRWNQQLFGRISDGPSGSERWDQDIWRADAAVGWRISAHAQTKLQYSYSHQEGPLQQGEQLVAAQLTLRF